MLSSVVSYAQWSNSLHNMYNAFSSCISPKQLSKNNLTRSLFSSIGISIHICHGCVGTICYGYRGNFLSHSTILISFHAFKYVSFFLAGSIFCRGYASLCTHGCWLAFGVDAYPLIHTPPLVTTQILGVSLPLCSVVTICTFPPLFSHHLSSNCGQSSITWSITLQYVQVVHGCMQSHAKSPCWP